jgi:hypothetical protein
LLRSSPDLAAEEAVNQAFTLTEELARLLHNSGHREMAALFDGIGDMGELSRRRMARDGANSLIGPRSDTLDYALDQMAELAELMTRHGAHDAAALFRMPGQLRFAAETPRFAAGASPMAA